MYGVSPPLYGMQQQEQEQNPQLQYQRSALPGPAVYDYGSAAAKPVQSFPGRAFARIPRRHLNVVPALIAMFVPWLLFVFLYAMECFAVHYFYPSLTIAAVVVSAIVVLAVCAHAVRERLRRLGYLPYFIEDSGGPSWIHVMAMLLSIAWLWAVIMGGIVFDTYQSPYQVINTFNAYNNIAPESAKGTQYMDAGTALFVANTTLDLSKAMGFKNGATYCVAPIVHGNQALASYDFWAVGTDCCNATQAQFQCGSYNDTQANGGIRLMNDEDRAFYRLAVQEAEVQYGIKSVHPVFFTWTVDPVGQLENIHWQVVNYYLIGILAHGIWQVVVVTSCSIFFSRVGGASS